MTNITAIATGDTNSYGVINYTSSSPTMTNVTASAMGGTNSYGVYNYTSSSPTMTNVTTIATGGVNNYGVYNESASPDMMNVKVSAMGGTNSYGVYHFNSSSTIMTNVTATASGGSQYNYGVQNNTSSTTMTNVTATASGLGLPDSSNHGISSNGGFALTMNNVTASAYGGASSAGFSNYGTGPVKINHSVVKGLTNTIFNFSGTTLTGNTQLDGGVVFNGMFGTLTCVGAYSGTYVALNSECQEIVTGTAPGAPTGVSAVANLGLTTVTVSFDAPASDGGSSITGYTVSSIPAAVAFVDLDAGSTSLTHRIDITKLSSGATYTFTVTAKNSVGTGPTSAASNSIVAP
jgi:hypothetical protein